jgi:hypothetical protein
LSATRARANGEFRQAVDLRLAGTIDVTGILSGTYRPSQAAAALQQPGDRSKVVKLHRATKERFM